MTKRIRNRLAIGAGHKNTMASKENKRARSILNIDLNLLVVLQALLEEVNVTKAATRVCLSQPATSSALNRLRDIFDDPLLVRFGNKMELTRFALELKEPLSKAIRAINEVLGEPLPFDPAKANTTVRIGASDYIGITLLPELEKEIQKNAPGIKLHISPLREPEILNRLEKEDVDILIGHFAAFPHFKRETIFMEKFVCVMRKQHPLFKVQESGSIELEDFLAYQHVIIAREGRKIDMMDQWLATIGLERKVGIHVPHFLVAPSIVAINDMIAIEGERVVNILGDSLGLSSLDLPSEYGTGELAIHMLWQEHTDQDPALSWMRSLIKDVSARI